MPDINPFATNQHGVAVQPLDYSHEHTPSMKVYHGVSIAINGSTVGRIQSWHPTNAYNRKITAVYELSAHTFGQPVDVVPAGADGEYTAAITRGEVWNQELEIACGYTDVWETLSDQTRPFTIQEFWFRGRDVYQIWAYTGCWFNEKNFADPWESTGEGKVNVSGNIVYVRRGRVA